MKKFIALSLAAIMVVSVCACGSEKTKSAGKEIFHAMIWKSRTLQSPLMHQKL